MIDVISTLPCPFTSNMPHRVFEIHELARLISCHLAPTDCKATLSLACTVGSSKRLPRAHYGNDTTRCPSSSMSHLSWTRRYAMEVPFPNRNSSRHQATDHKSLRNSWHRFRRYASWMRQLILSDREANHRVTDDILNRLLMGSPDGLVCPALCHLTCYLQPTNLRFIPHFISPNLIHLSISVQQAHPDLGLSLRTLPAPCLQ